MRTSFTLLFWCAALLTVAPAHAQQPTPAEAKKAADDAWQKQQEYLLHNDWPNLQRYAAANRRLPAPTPGVPRVSDAECRSDSRPSPAASTPINSTPASGTKA